MITHRKTTRQWLALSLVTSLVMTMNLTSLPAFGKVRPVTSTPAPSALTKTALTKTADAAPAKTQALQAWGKLPLSFEINQGQAAAPVKFLARGQGYGLFLTGNEAVFKLRRDHATAASTRSFVPHSASVTTPASEVLRMKLAGANAAPQILGTDELPGKSSYFIGNDPSQWRANVASYARVQYRDVYPGVNLVYYGNQQQLEYDFVVAPGADPRAIRLKFDGARSLRVEANGELVLKLKHGEIRQHAPVIYQEVAGNRQPIAGRYVIRHKNGQREVGFEIGEYDHSKALVIDPVLVYSTYLGGNGSDFGEGIAVDGSGNVYVAGFTTSTNFPSATRVPTGTAGGGGDAFVIKLNTVGNTLLYSAYIGGAADDATRDLAIDSLGNAYLTGQTQSSNFPTLNAAQPNFGGGTCGSVSNPRPCADAFVAKLNAAGSALVYSTFLGGSGEDIAFGIAVDSSNNAVVAGQTASTNFPLLGPVRNTNAGGTDAFVTKYNSTGALSYSTYLGSQGDDAAQAVAVDATGAAYVVGYTGSTNFPTQAPLQPASGGNRDAFVSKLNPGGTALVYSTYLGGNADDIGYGVAVDSSNNVYLSGVTNSPNFPTLNPAQMTYGGGSDAFVTKINAAGSALVYSTFLGGSGDDFGSRVVVDATFNAHVTGNTFSTNFPLINIVPGTAGSGSDAFVVKLNPAGTTRLVSTYIGGNGNDYGNAIAVDSSGNIYITGDTGSTSFPTTAPLQGTAAANGDLFITKINPSQNVAYVTTVSAASFKGDTIAPEEIVAGFGVNLSTSTDVATTLPLPTTLAGSTVRIKDSNGVERPSPLFFVAPGQINYQVPPLTAAGRASVIVTGSGGSILAAGVINVTAVGPGLFTSDSTGNGAPAAYAIRVKANNQQIIEQVATGSTPIQIDLGPVGERVFVILYGTGIRGRSALNSVVARYAANGTTVADTAVEYAGPQGGLIGLDQINLVLPRSLAGRGNLDLLLIVDGLQTNAVKINIK